MTSLRMGPWTLIGVGALGLAILLICQGIFTGNTPFGWHASTHLEWISGLVLVGLATFAVTGVFSGRAFRVCISLAVLGAFVFVLCPREVDRAPGTFNYINGLFGFPLQHGVQSDAVAPFPYFHCESITRLLVDTAVGALCGFLLAVLLLALRHRRRPVPTGLQS
jgi:hypothetical protein